MEVSNITIKSKLPKVGTTIFAIMTQMASDFDAINLSQGFPDFACSKDLIQLVNDYMRKGYNQYAPMAGISALREVIAEKIQELYSTKINPESEITITPGATQAIYAAISAVVHEGDEVIIFEPAYDCYAPAIELNGGIPIYIELKLPNYTIDWELVKKRITQRTRMIILNTPQNPTGSVLNTFDMLQLQKITDQTDILILSDEVYEHIIFDEFEHQSIFRFPGLAERSFAVYSFGKIFHATGWKLAYCVAPEYLMKEFRKVYQFQVFTCNTPIQYALADFLKKKEAYLSLNSFYQEKRDYFLNLIKDSRFKHVPSSGTYFQLLSYNKITDEPDTDYAIRLTKEHKIASIPISVFYHEKIDNKVLRFCFAKSNDTLKKAAEILCKI